MCWTTSVGGLARSLLHDRNYLRHHEEDANAAPLLDADALIRLDLGVVANDRCATIHDDARRDLRVAVETGRLRLTWDDLRRVGQGLPDLTIAKAVGRIDAREAGRAFLVATLEDATAAVDVRLAAASALTRDTDDSSTATLARARAWLDGLRGGALGARFLAEVEKRKRHEERWGEIHGIHLAAEMEKITDRVKEAVTADHPLALEALRGAFGLYVVRGAVRQTLVDSLLRIAAGLGDHRAAWDTYGDAPYVLEALAVPVWGSERYHDQMEPLRPAERARLLDAIRPYLDAR